MRRVEIKEDMRFPKDGLPHSFSGERRMSSELLYQVFRVKSYRLTKLETEEHRVFLHVEPQEHRICCPVCRSRNVIRRGESVRWFRNLPVGGELTWVIATLPRVECRDCGLVR